MKSPAQRAIVEVGRVLDRDLSWRSSFPGLVDARSAMLKELWDNMGSFSQGLPRRSGMFSPKSSACDVRQNAREPGGLEALP